MRSSYTQPNTNPRTLDYRTSENNPWTNGKTPRDHKNDPRMPIKVLLPWLSKKNQTVGNAMWRLHQIQTNQQQSNKTKDDQQHGTRPGPGRHSRDWHIAESTQHCRIPKHRYDDWCIFTLPIRIPKTERHSKDNRTMPCWRHDQTCISANFSFVRQRLTIQIRSRRRNNANFRNPNQPCVHKTCTNDWHPRKDTRLNQNCIKNINGWKTFNVAQIRSDRSHEL